MSIYSKIALTALAFILIDLLTIKYYDFHCSKTQKTPSIKVVAIQISIFLALGVALVACTIIEIWTS